MNGSRWSLLARRGLASRPCAVLRPLLSPLVSVDHLGAAAAPTQPFLVALTVDVEAGYVRDDGTCAWSDEEPRALQGFTHGLPVVLELAREAGVPLSLLLSTQAFVGNGEDDGGLRIDVERALADGHELGLHLHPRTDEPLQAALGRELRYASAHFYGADEQEQMLAAARGLVRNRLGTEAERDLFSFRWGNWALSTASVVALERTGFTVDSTALPGLSGHLGDDRRFDWSRLERPYPFRLSRADYQDPRAQDSAVLELPVPTFRFLRPGLADPAWGVVLQGVLALYHRRADRSRAPFVFVVCTHSCELVRSDGSPTALVDGLRDLLRFGAGLADVRFVTLREAARRVEAAALDPAAPAGVAPGRPRRA